RPRGSSVPCVTWCHASWPSQSRRPRHPPRTQKGCETTAKPQAETGGRPPVSAGSIRYHCRVRIFAALTLILLTGSVASAQTTFELTDEGFVPVAVPEAGTAE